ncbi:MAG: hypothetical protein ACRCUP_03940 [Mycoplasmatales bacterium]
MLFFLDVDNTILEHTSSYSNNTEGRIHNIFGHDPVTNEEAIKLMYEGSICSDSKVIKELLINQDNFYVLTKTNNKIYEKYKRIRIAKLLGITVEELENLSDSKNRKKYITIFEDEPKPITVKKIFNLTTLKDCVLVDDYSQNIIDWETEYGIGIKFHNEYNSPLHPTGGLVISNFKLLSHNIQEQNVQDLIIGTTLIYYFQKYLPSYPQINFLNLIQNDIEKRFDLENRVFENTKNSFTEFLTQYYYFISKHQPQILADSFKKHYNEHVNCVLVNPFTYQDSMFTSLLGHDNFLTIGFSSKEKTRVVRDIYISVPQTTYSDYTDQQVRRSVKHLLQLLNLYKNK